MKRDIKKKLIETARNAINLEIEGKAPYVKGGTRFGGLPDVPENFEWPYFECTTYDDQQSKLRPLNFLLQINLEEFASYDKENLLPKKGLLLFFNIIEADYYPTDFAATEDEKCTRVYYFEDISALKQAKAPEGINDGYYGVLPSLKIEAETQISYMDTEDFYEVYGNFDDDDYEDVYERLTGGERESRSKLLGWADIIQHSITYDLEINGRGYPLSTPEDYKRVSETDKEEARRNSAFDWVLLLQLDIVEDDDFELMYGDCGCLYVYIRREDLAARRFEKARFMTQCC